MAVSFHFADLTSSVTTQAVLGGVLGVSLVVNLILAITVVVLLFKAKCTTNQSSPMTSCSKEKEKVELSANELYGTGESIVIKPNVVYGMTLSTEPASQTGIYECVASQ